MWHELHVGAGAPSCTQILLWICFLEQSPTPDAALFGFSEYIAGLALLVIVYTITDVRYRFRITVAPGSLVLTTFWVLSVVGVATLLTGIWARERWLVPETIVLNRPLWDGLLAALFLALPITWIYYAAIRAPVYGRRNCEQYANALYRQILKGSDNDLTVIADEVGRSAQSLIALSQLARSRDQPEEEPSKSESNLSSKVSGYAHDLLLMIGNRKFCRNVVAAAPGTAIALFSAASESKRAGLPMWQFAKNISAEAIGNKDSILYHEDEGFESGYLGYVKPFSEAVYGNYHLVEELGRQFGSPLDIRYNVVGGWNAAQLSAYTRAVLVTWRSYLKQMRSLSVHSPALHRAMSHIQDACRDTYKLDGLVDGAFDTDVSRRLSVVVDFFVEVVTATDQEKGLPLGSLRVKDGNPAARGFCDHLARFMSEIIYDASRVTAPGGTCWAVQYNAVWTEFYGFDKAGATWDVVRFKLNHILFKEIRNLDRAPYYKSARILGLCLNVMGFGPVERGGIVDGYHGLAKAVRRWTKKNYMRLRKVQPDVAAYCLVGDVTFDDVNRRLVKTYVKGMSLEAPKDYLDLDPAPAG
jgi:hypothetical protein